MGDGGSSSRLRRKRTARSLEQSTAAIADMFRDLNQFDPVSPDYRRMQNRIIEHFLPMADAIARRFGTRGEPLEDLTQAARLGLVCAVRQFNPDRGTEFTAFAWPTITGAIRRHFRDNTWPVAVPRGVKDLTTKLGQLGDGLTQTLGHHPTAAELATELGAEISDVEKALVGRRAYRTMALEAAFDPDGVSIGDSLGCTDISFGQVEDWEMLRPLLIRLSERERHIVILRFYCLRTQSEIASLVGVSQMHVHRLLTKSLESMRLQLEHASDAAA